MNTNPPTPNPMPGGDAREMNDAVLKKLNSYRWKGRALTTIALSVGLLSIVAGVMIAWANAILIMPMARLVVEAYPTYVTTVKPVGTNALAPQNAEGKTPLPRSQIDLRHAQVTAANGQTLFFTAVSIALLGVGTLLTLVLVIFNRRVTLRQINESLAQISNQIRELQDGKST